MKETYKRMFKLTRSKIVLTILFALALTLPFFLVAVDNDPVYASFGSALSLIVSVFLLPISLINTSLNVLLDFFLSGFSFWKDGKETINLLTFVTIGIVYCYFVSSVIIYIFNSLSKQEESKNKPLL